MLQHVVNNICLSETKAWNLFGFNNSQILIKIYHVLILYRPLMYSSILVETETVNYRITQGHQITAQQTSQPDTVNSQESTPQNSWTLHHECLLRRSVSALSVCRCRINTRRKKWRWTKKLYFWRMNDKFKGQQWSSWYFTVEWKIHHNWFQDTLSIIKKTYPSIFDFSPLAEIDLRLNFKPHLLTFILKQGIETL